MKSVLITVLIILLILTCGLSARGEDVVYAVGYDNTILRFNGDSWQPIWQGVDETLRAVWESPSGVVFIVGDNGTIIRLEGGSWSQMASGTTRHFRDVWGFGDDDVFAVGFMGTILHYDGVGWSPMVSGTEINLYSVWGLSGSNLYAGGASGNLILHYDGSAWSEDYSDGLAQCIFEIWGSGPDNVYAFGVDDNYFHYDGAAWGAITLPMSGVISAWGTAPDDIYTVRYGIYHYNGHKWKSMESCGDGTESYTDIWGLSSSNIYAVGQNGLICHYDGTSWTTDTSPYTGSLYGVFCRPPDDVWAVGAEGVVLHYDGIEWDVVLGMLPQCSFKRVWGSSSNDVYVTGCWDQLMHFNGSEWQKMSVQQENGAPLVGIGGTGPDNIYAVGGFGDEVVTCAFVCHFDGTSWSEDLPYYGICGLSDIWVDPGGGFYAIGTCWDPIEWCYYEVVYRYIESTFSEELSTTYYNCWTDEYHRISGGGASRPFVTGEAEIPLAGYGGIIRKRTESGWNYLTQDVPCNMDPKCHVWPEFWYGIWPVSETEIWVAGENGQVLHWTAGGYTEHDTGTGVLLHAIWGRSSSDVYAVGANGTIVHYDGSSWTIMETGTTATLNDVWGTSGISTAVQSYSVPDMSIALIPNYPNPFNPMTTITYSVFVRCRVKLCVYDVSGRLVRQLLDDERDPGTYVAHWNGIDDEGHPVASGTYFCRLTSGEESASHKIVLLR